MLSSNYINSIVPVIQQSSTTSANTINQEQTSQGQPIPQPAAPVQQDQPPPELAQIPQPVRRNQDIQDPQGDREDDWLGILHNVVSFLVLFSIIYYYSSIERFFVICVVVLFLIL